MIRFHKYFIRIFALLLAINVCHCTTANDACKSKIAKLSISPVSLRSNLEDFAPTQYSIDWYVRVDEGSEVLFTTICENRDGNSHVLFLTNNKLPFAYFGPDVSLFATAGNKLAYLKGLKFAFDCDNLRFPNFLLSSELKRSHATLDLFRTMHDLLGGIFNCKAINQLDRCSLINGPSKALVDFSRRYERGRFPLASIHIQAADGTGYKVCNIRRGLPERTIITSCNDYSKLCIHDDEISEEKELQSDVLYKLLPLDDMDKVSSVIADDTCLGVRERWRDQLLLASEEKRERLENALIEVSSAKPGIDITSYVQQIHTAIALDVHLPSLESRTGGESKLSTFVEPEVCREVAVHEYGSYYLREIEDALVNVANQSNLSESIRLKSIDYLQTLNIKANSTCYNKLLLLGDESESYRALISAGAVRMRHAANVDINALHVYMKSDGGLPWLKLVCLEALFLAKEDIDQDTCHQLLRETKFSDYYGGRVALAAMHSKMGRKIARQGIRERWSAFPPEAFFSHLRWATDEQNHSEWATLLDFCNEVLYDAESTLIEKDKARAFLLLNELQSQHP